ncbi:putative ABC transporter substrate-binding lipoprotein YhfQ precursor [compost metagenome]
MKKLFMLIVSLVLLTTLLGGCGSNAPDGKSGNAAAATTAAASPEATQKAASSEAPSSGFPRTYTDMAGHEVTIAEKPKRVAVAFFHFVEPWFALGITPVAGDGSDTLLGGFLSLQPYADQKSQVTDLGSPLNLEALLEAKPDLIVSATPYNDEIYEQLKAIAPVVVLNNELDWKTRLLEFSKLVGEEEKAQAKIAEIESQIGSSRTELAGLKDKTVAFLGLNNKGGFTAYGIDRCAAFYDTGAGLGLTPPDGYPAVHGQNNQFTIEGIVKLNPDYIFVWDDATTDADETALAQLKGNAIWNTLSAVQNGKVFMLDRSAFSGGPLGVEYGVKSVAEAMLR